MTAGNLLVALDVADVKGDSSTWVNHGSLGPFTKVGTPSVTPLGKADGVLFNGKTDAYLGPPSPNGLEGKGDRSIEVWVNNPTLDSNEETILSWSDRGGPDGTMMSFNYGSPGAFCAVTHWVLDMSWGTLGPPAANQWHHLAYTYDGTTARVYQDGAEKNKFVVVLNTKKNFSINLAAQRKGTLAFTNEFNGVQIGGSLALAIVRVHDGALTAEQIKQNFDAESARFR